MAKIVRKIENLRPGKNYIVTAKVKNSDINVESENANAIRIAVPVDPTIPDYPLNLQLFAYFEQVMFVFDNVSDKDVISYQYELYESSQVTGSYPNFSLIANPLIYSTGTAGASVFTIAVENSTDVENIKYYGRVRTIDNSGNTSSWSPLVETDKETPLIGNQYIASLTAAKITAGTIGSHQIILSQAGPQSNFAAPANMAVIRSSDYNGSYNSNTNAWTIGTNGWIIAGDGHAEFSSAAIRGSLVAASVYIDANNRWKTAANGSILSTPEFKVGSSSQYLYFDGTNVTFTGNLIAAGGTFSGDLSAAGGTFSGDLSAAGGTFTGELSAASGSFEGDVSGSTFIGGLIESTNGSTSINLNDGTFSFANGNLTWDNVDVFIRGGIQADHGRIGLWQIEESTGRLVSSYSVGDPMIFSPTENGGRGAILGSGVAIGNGEVRADNFEAMDRGVYYETQAQQWIPGYVKEQDNHSFAFVYYGNQLHAIIDGGFELCISNCGGNNATANPTSSTPTNPPVNPPGGGGGTTTTTTTTTPAPAEDCTFSCANPTANGWYAIFEEGGCTTYFRGIYSGCVPQQCGTCGTTPAPGTTTTTTTTAGPVSCTAAPVYNEINSDGGNGWTKSGAVVYRDKNYGNAGCLECYSSMWQLYTKPGCPDYDLFIGCTFTGCGATTTTTTAGPTPTPTPDPGTTTTTAGPTPTPTSPPVECNGNCSDKTGYSFAGLVQASGDPFGNCPSSSGLCGVVYEQWDKAGCPSLACFQYCVPC